jgi:hypothetical protein
MPQEPVATIQQRPVEYPTIAVQECPDENRLMHRIIDELNNRNANWHEMGEDEIDKKETVDCQKSGF